MSLRIGGKLKVKGGVECFSMFYLVYELKNRRKVESERRRRVLQHVLPRGLIKEQAYA